MQSSSLISSIAYQWRSWMQMLSVAFVEQRVQLVSSVVITVISLFITSWVFVPFIGPWSAGQIQLNLLIPGIWLLVMSHLSFNERIHRPLNFAASMPVPLWKWWVSRTIVTLVIALLVTGLVLLATFAWVRLSEDPSKIESNLNDGIYYTLLTSCAVACCFFAWTITRIGYLWLVALMAIISFFWSRHSNSDTVLDVRFFPHIVIFLPISLLLSFWGYINRLKGKTFTISRAQKQRGRSNIYPWVIRACALAAFVGSMILLLRSNKDQASILRTEYLDFYSEEKDVPIIEPLIDSADENYQVVKALFDPVKPGLRPRVVITDAFDDSGTLARANWNQVRVGRDALGVAEFYPTEEVLRHELAHVFLMALSDGKLRRNFKAMQVFHEGVATYCESLPDRNEITPSQKRRILSTLTNEKWNKPFSFSEILEGRGDYYGHGLMLAEALVEEFGTDSFRKIATEAANLGTKSIFYHGEAFWYLLCNRLGYSVELLETRYLKVKNKYENQYSQILSLPKPEVEFTWHDEEVILRPKTDHENGLARLVINIDRVNDTFLQDFAEPLTVDAEGNIRITYEELKLLPRSDSGAIEYQAGWKIDSLPVPLYIESRRFPWNYRMEKNHENFVLNAKVIQSSSEHPNRGKSRAMDGSSATNWHSKYGGNDGSHPYELVIDLGETTEIQAFHYMTRQDHIWNGTFKECEFFVSEDPNEFHQLAAKATFEKKRTLQKANFDPPIEGRYLMVRVISEIDRKHYACAAEIIVEKMVRD